MPRAPIRTDERSEYEAKLDIEYAVCLATLHCKLYRNLDRSIRIFTAFCASSAVVVLLAEIPSLAAILSIFTAALTAFSAVVDLAKIADRHEHDRKAFLGLKAKVDGMTVAAIDTKISKLRSEAASTLRGLQYPAFNSTVCSAGRPDWARTLTRWERFLDLIA